MDRVTKVLLLIVLVLFGLYLPTNIPRGKVLEFKTKVDDLIPLWTPFVVIYLSYFVFLGLSLIYFIRVGVYKTLRAALLGITISCLVAYLFYFFFQNRIDRPGILNNNIFDFAYSKLNELVAPFNAFPSLHVAISVVCALAYSKIKSKYFPAVLIWVILIIASTVLTKQHYFLDVISGLLLGLVSFRISVKIFDKYSA